MMWNKTLKLSLYIALIIFAASCSGKGQKVNGGNYNGEGDGGKTGESVVSIAFLKSLYNGYPRKVTENYVIEGWVSSSDRTGNFYKTLVVEDATGGIEIKLDMDRIYREFKMGDMVKVYCNSLSLGAYGGLVQLGSGSGGEYETGYIAPAVISKHIAKTNAEPISVKPELLNINSLSAANLSRFAAFINVVFTEADGTAQWCTSEWDEDKGKYVFVNTDRVLKDAAGNEMIVRTSAYAEFAGWSLPQGRVYVAGVISWFNGKYQLRIIDPNADIAELD